MAICSTHSGRQRASSLAIELPQLLVYRLDQAETITPLIPAACLRSGSQLRTEHISGAPWRMLPPAGRAFVTGSLLQQASEAEVLLYPGTKLKVVDSMDMGGGLYMVHLMEVAVAVELLK